TVNPTPDVNPIDDTVLCEGILFDSISFSGSVAGTSYLWDASDTTIGISARNGVNSTPGFVATNNIFGPITSMFTITPVYTNNNVTCIGGKENFTISVLPEPSIYPLPDITVCNGTQVPVTNVAGPVSGTIYQWRNSNTAISLSDSGIGNIPSFNATNLTSLTQLSTVSITPVVELSGVQCAGAVEDFLITVNPTPHVVNQDIEICDGESTNIALTSNIPSSFTWFATPNPNVFNETSFPIQVTGVINDNLILVGTSVQTVDYNVVPTSLAHGCIGPDSVVRVKINPLPQVSFTTLNPVLCEDNEIDFFNTSASGLNFTWDFDDGNSSLLVNPKNTFANVGTYVVKLKGVDVITGCSDSVLNPLDILSLPISDFSYSDSLGCDNLEVFFFTDSSNRDWTYSWDFGTGDFSLQYGVAGHYYDTTGCFDVSLKVTSKEGCVSETNSLNPICVYKTPLASFKMDRNTFSTLETALVIFENTSQFENQYVWEFGDGQSSLAENPVNVYPEKAGVYRVKLRVNNFDGCADSTYGIVRVIQDIAVYAPNTFTPNRDDINQVFLPILSEGFDKETYNFKVFNRWGQIVFETRNINEGWNGLCGGNSYINGCPQGTYVWQLSIALEGASEREIYRGHINLIR
ncbi:MAG: PKD domain-containing protein, partial [Wenyingzhuangia sp.]|uniref:PKD domain-containing protein n=1 Tax=Wenyingzhuangia sp. TaxID=1964193 RepID=UPI00321C18A8